MKITSIGIALLLMISAVPVFDTQLWADIVWSESVNGDLSTVPSSPTALTFANGSNTVVGTLSGNTDSRDFMTFTIGPGQFLTGLTLDTLVADGVGFQGLNSGATGLIPGNDPSGAFLGLEFVLPDFLGTDMLIPLSESNNSYGAIGFTIPLGQGTYTYLIQEITPGQSMSYQLSFNVVPEPSSILLAATFGVIASLRRRRSVG